MLSAAAGVHVVVEDQFFVFRSSMRRRACLAIDPYANGLLWVLVNHLYLKAIFACLTK
jgi:hypothetical protein